MPPAAGPPGPWHSGIARAAAVALAAGAVVWAAIAIVRLGGAPPPTPAGGDEESADSVPVFSGPAYSPQATVADLKQASLQIANELAADYPDSPDAWNVTAQLQFHLGNTPEAVNLWQRCLTANPKLGDAQYGLGYIAHLEGDNAKAVERFRAALAVSPLDRRIPLLLAESLTRLGKPEEAVPLLAELLKSGQSTLYGLVSLGQIYLDMREYDKARAVFERAVQLDPASREAQFGLGTAWARLGDTEKSRQAMSAFQALVANRRAESAARVMGFDDLAKGREVAVLIHNEAAKVYLAHGNLQKAEGAWCKTSALDRKNIPCRMELVAIYERTGRDRAALRVSEELRDLEPERADHWLNVGVLNVRLGRRDAALAAVDKAIAMEPDNPKHRQAREVIRSAP